MLADKAKSLFISKYAQGLSSSVSNANARNSISHELRTPLHGVSTIIDGALAGV